jgi:hypothetical protein
MIARPSLRWTRSAPIASGAVLGRRPPRGGRRVKQSEVSLREQARCSSFVDYQSSALRAHDARVNARTIRLPLRGTVTYLANFSFFSLA